ncbi:hypothetical protein GCM10010912_15610 [Paenibacillus albidus]|uniref:Uncharacterized protein n=1 Tax=Paenibacillus albidus TaxID=2041023 RepID=A0A917FCV3_9BACL|nr:hypothetical protein [Paenibacillus albidus]GGF71341.1 hypothetical protein GCM10010912_15610 [Paenibacillus albidus]
MTLLKDSSNLDQAKTKHEQLWADFLNTDEETVDRILDKARVGLLPMPEKLRSRLRPFRTPLLWLIPLGALATAVLLYVVFIWAALWVE